MHNLWCDTLQQTETFPQPDSVLRVPTAEEFAVYGHGKPKKAPRTTGPVANNVVSDDKADAADDEGPGVSDTVAERCVPQPPSSFPSVAAVRPTPTQPKSVVKRNPLIERTMILTLY